MNRIGIGYDIHRLVEGRRLVIGGVAIPYEKGLLGHSDADVLLHAISDAVLGALAHGDIGVYFPPDDDRYKDMASPVILRKALSIAADEGYRLINIDSVVIAQQPKLSHYYAQIIESIAGMTGLHSSSIGVKAKTNEGLDAVGKGEAIAAYAVVLMNQ
jgi:2-C-methyl-D-erythritol 2,4-cyclodiphosphate synthase